MTVPDQPRHILFVIVGISAGTGTFCKSLAAGLRKFHGNELRVSLLTFRPDALFPENAVCFDQTFVLNTRVHDDWRRMLDLPLAFFRFRRAVAGIRPDLIFAIGTFSNVVASLAISSVPVVLSEHLNMTLRLRASRFGRFVGWFMRRAYPSRLMVVASQELAEDLKKNFGVRRVKVIPNGIDAAVVRLRASEPPATELPPRYFISVGRLTEQKDIGTLLRAFALARKAGLLEELVVAGDGEQRAMLQELADQLGVGPQVHFLGHCPNPYPLIRKARALVLSSIWEGFAYVPIEAMALGVPVICTACPSGPAEIVGSGQFGLLVPPRDPRQLADAMLKISADNSLHQLLSAKAQERADQLSIQNMARQYRDLLLAELENAES